MKILNKEILSYYELTKSIDQSACILNNETLNYLESLLHLDISALDNGKNNFSRSEYLSQLKFFESLILHNMYKESLKLVDKDRSEYIVVNNVFNKVNIDIVMNRICFNIFSFDYTKDVPNIYLYSHDSNKFICDKVDDKILNYLETEYIISREKEKVLQKFLSRNNLNLYDFDNVTDSKEYKKVRKYPYANVYIK